MADEEGDASDPEICIPLLFLVICKVSNASNTCHIQLKGVPSVLRPGLGQLLYGCSTISPNCPANSDQPKQSWADSRTHKFTVNATYIGLRDSDQMGHSVDMREHFLVSSFETLRLI